MDKWTWKNRTRFRMFDNIVYTIACFATFGLVYLIRVIITESVRYALWEMKDAEDYREFLQQK